MATNEILPFAESASAPNLLTQAQYAADPERLSGNLPDIARQELANKIWKQSATVCSGFGEFLKNSQSANVTDSLTPAQFAGIILAAIGGGIQNGAYNTAVAGGTANAITATYVPAVTTLAAGLTLLVRASSANTTTTPTFAPNGLAAKPIVKGANLPLAVGDIAGAGHWLEFQYDLTLAKWVLMNPALGVIVPPTASETVQGVVELATPAEVAAVDTTRAVTASSLLKSPGVFLAKLTLNTDAGGGTISITSQYNVASVQKIAPGHYRINFADALPNATYGVAGSATGGNYTLAAVVVTASAGGNYLQKTTTAIQIYVLSLATGAGVDVGEANILIF